MLANDADRTGLGGVPESPGRGEPLPRRRFGGGSPAAEQRFRCGAALLIALGVRRAPRGRKCRTSRNTRGVAAEPREIPKVEGCLLVARTMRRTLDVELRDDRVGSHDVQC